MAMLSTANIIIYILGAFSIILFIWVIMLELRLKKLFKGGKPEGLEELLMNINTDFKALHSSNKEMEEYLRSVESRLKNTIKSVRMLRFNPFNNSGSNQSFTMALLNEDGDGAVITGIHSREKINVYAKPIANFQSEHKLTAEEEAVIKKEPSN